MRLLTLDIANFRVIRSAHLDFPDNLIGIIGPNGSGKSTLVEALSWALYGHQVARSGKEEIKSSFARPTDACEVSLTFEVRGELYRVVRRLVGKAERSEVELYRGAESESMGVSETRSYVGNLLGLDWRGFLTSFLARQQELNALTSLAPARRREHLAGMLGIERLDRAIQAVKDDTRLDEERVHLISQQLANRDAVTARVEELREQVLRLEQAVGEQAGAYARATADLREKLTVLREHQARQDACSRLAAQVDAGLQSRRLLEDQRQRQNRELEHLQQSQLQISRLETRLAGMGSIESELQQYREASRQVRRRSEVELQLHSLEAEVQTASDRLNLSTESLSRINRQLADIPADSAEQLESCRKGRQQARDAEVRLQAERDRLATETGRMESQLSDYAKFGPGTVCDRCHRPFDEHELAEFTSHLEAELTQLRQEAESIVGQLRTAKVQGLEIAGECARLETLVDSRRELSNDLRVLETEQRELRERLEKCDQQEEFLQGQLAEIGEVRFDQARFEALEREYADLQAAQTELDQLRGGLGRLPAVESDLRETDAKLSGLDADITRLRGELTRMGFDEALLRTAVEAYEVAQQATAAAHEENLRLSHELDLARQELVLKQDQLKEYEQAATQLEVTRTRQYYGQSLARLFADFRKYLIASIRPRLAELTSQLLNDMTDGRYPMVDLDEDYNLLIFDYGSPFGVERFSGGESDLSNLCLRLAISLSLVESAGLERSFVILDEVFGSQDEVRRDLIFRGLANLKGQFPQILLITHFEELKHKVETLIEVVPTANGWSEVRINGSVA